MTTKKTIILVVIILVVGVIAFLGSIWVQNKMLKVKYGSARSNFPYTDYTQEELNKMYPQQIENNALTTQTPEQTHAMFVAALKKGDFDEATKCCFVEGDRVKIKEGLNKIKNDGTLPQMIKDLDTEIKLNVLTGSKATYDYFVKNDDKNMASGITFLKDENGVWLIESL